MEELDKKITNLYDAYLKISEMEVSWNTQITLLKTLLAEENPNAWHVTGFTKEALKIFKENDFKKKTGMGINRSHRKDRHETCVSLLRNKEDYTDVTKWWSFYESNDKTILATSSENSSGTFSDVYNFNNPKYLFRAKGYSWQHGDAEIAILKKYYEKSITT